LGEKLPQLDDVGTDDIFFLQLTDEMHCPRHTKFELVVRSTLDITDFLDECDDIVPFEILRGWMSEQRLERFSVAPETPALSWSGIFRFTADRFSYAPKK
jgi:hypothetical protein